MATRGLPASLLKAAALDPFESSYNWEIDPSGSFAMKCGLMAVLLLSPMAAPAVEIIRLQNEILTLEVTPGLGGRGLWFSLKGHPNLLKVGEAVQAQPAPAVSAAADDIAYLGHDVWVGPQNEWWTHQDINPARRDAQANWPPDPYLAYATTRIIERTPSRVVLEGVDSPVSGVRLRKTFQLSSTHADTVEVHASARNIRDTDVARDLWFNTRLPHSTRAFVPVEKESDVRVQSLTGTSIGPLLPRIERGLFSLDSPPFSTGETARRGKVFAQPSAGWMAGFADNQLFVIRFPHQLRERIHPDQAQVELYLDDQAEAGKGLLEMELHSLYATLRPGESLHATEWWTVLPYGGPDTREAQIAFLCEVAAPQLSLAHACGGTSATQATKEP